MWTVLSDDARAVIGKRGGLVVAVLYAPLDVPFFDTLDAHLAAADLPPRFALLLVRAGASPGKMSPEARERTQALLRREGARLAGFAYVNGGSGLKAGLLRGAMNAALVAAGFTGKVFTDTGEALAWLAGLPGAPSLSGAERAELRALVAGLEARA